jgi:hypothetical protein
LGIINPEFDQIFFKEERMVLLNLFFAYCVRALKINGTYSCTFTNSREKYGIETTGSCNFNDKKIFVYSRNRGFADILRTVAHELAHISQHEQGIFLSRSLHFSSEAEDDATEKAGELLSAFGQVVGFNIIYEGKR